MKYQSVGKATALSALISLGALTQASAQETMTLKFGHPFSNDHWVWQEGGKFFSDTLAKETNGAVKIDVFPGGQTGNDYPAALESGVLDLAIVVAGYTPEKLPMSTVPELPVQIGDACGGTRMFWEVAKPGGVLDRAEFEPNGMHPLFVFANPPYTIYTTSKEIKTLEDVKGLKLRAAGAPMQKTARALGAVAVQLSGPEIYDAVNRGTIDGVFLSYNSVPPFSLESSFKYVVEGPAIGQGSTVFAMSRDTWDGLSDEMKKNVEDAAMAAQDHICGYLDELNQRVRKEMIEQHGLVVNTLPQEEIDRWAQAAAPVIEEWGKELDAMGRPGTEAAQAFVNAK